MSHSSYTASERRGILAIAILALLLIGGGVSLSLCGRNTEEVDKIPVVVEHPEMIDSIAIRENDENATNKSSHSSKTKKSNSKTKRSVSKKSKEKKTYRRRSPLDEPV